MLAAVGRRMRTDPVGTMGGLGVPVDDFEMIARALYAEMVRQHPERAPKPPPPPKVVYAPPPPAPPPRAAIPMLAPPSPPSVERRWWCFTTATGGYCDETKADCEVRRVAGLLCSSQPEGVQRDACENAAAQVKLVSACEQQERAVCFLRHSIVDETGDRLCAPTVKDCKANRTFTLKNMTDDVKVKSDCKVTE